MIAQTSIRRRLIATTAATLLFAATCSLPAHAQIAVYDGPNFGEWITSIGNEVKSWGLQLEGYIVQGKQWATQNLQWLQQVQQYALQAEQYTAELMVVANFIHHPSLGALMGMINAAGLGNSLPVNPYAAMGLVYGLQNLGSGGGGLASIQGLLSSLSQISGQAWNIAHVYTPVDRSWASAQLIQTANANAGMSGAMASAYGDLNLHSQTLQPIRSGLLNSSDTKSVLDATGQAAVETAWGVNQLAKIQSMTGSYLAQENVRRQRDDECMVMSIDAFLSSAPATVGLGAMPANPGPCPPTPAAPPSGGSIFGGATGGGPGANTVGGVDPGDSDLIMPPPPPPAPNATTGSVDPTQAAALTNAGLPTPPVSPAGGAAADTSAVVAGDGQEVNVLGPGTDISTYVPPDPINNGIVPNNELPPVTLPPSTGNSPSTGSLDLGKT